MFWTKSVGKKYLHSKRKKGNMPIEFCIFELVKVKNFSFKCHFYVLLEICPGSAQMKK